MAIIYSYPHAVPTINDMVLGARFRENEGISTNSFYISDLVDIIQEEIIVGIVPTLQQVTTQGANTTVQMKINGVDVATIDDIPETPDLQQVVTAGGIVLSGSNELTLSASSLSILNPSTSAGTALRRDSLRFNIYDPFEDRIIRMDLSTSGLTDNRSITFPDANGMVALTSDIPTPTYKVYTALLTQTGGTDPVITELENTIGTITITRILAGVFRIASAALFTLNKTTFDITPIEGFIKQGQLNNVNNIQFETRDDANIASDGLLTSKKLEIRVYN